MDIDLLSSDLEEQETSHSYSDPKTVLRVPDAFLRRSHISYQTEHTVENSGHA